MHTVTDYTRMHYAGSIPKGEGEVYNTTAVNRYQLPPPYVPYIYAGGAERGVAVFSSNDAGWIAADPAYQLLRNTSNISTGEGTMTLQVCAVSLAACLVALYEKSQMQLLSSG